MDHHRKQEVPSDTNTAKTPGAIAVNDFSPNTSQCPNQYGPRAKDDTFKQPAVAGNLEQQPGIHCQQKAGKDDSATFELNVRGWPPGDPALMFAWRLLPQSACQRLCQLIPAEARLADQRAGRAEWANNMRIDLWRQEALRRAHRWLDRLPSHHKVNHGAAG